VRRDEDCDEGGVDADVSLAQAYPATAVAGSMPSNSSMSSDEMAATMHGIQEQCLFNDVAGTRLLGSGMLGPSGGYTRGYASPV
jgi:hypothetical protein